MSLRILCFIVIAWICTSCAKESTPTGGPKDSIPPTLVRSIPAQKQLNFKSKEIELTLSESIILNNPMEQIIVTPAVGKEFKVDANKKNVTINFEQELADSTTYTINFRDAVQDITEKNSVKNLQLVFSTGSYIDSLIIEGSIYDLLKGKNIKDGTVAMALYTDTFNIFKHKPSYITKTRDNGSFKIENLKAGRYYIYAFEDKNKNLIVDSKTESYGSLTKPLEIKENIKKISIPLIRLDARSLKLTNSRPYNNYFNIKTTKNLIHYSLLSDSTKIISSFGEDQSNIKVFNTFGGIDSLKVKLSAKDSIGNSLDTALYVKFNKRETTPEKFSMNLTENKIQANSGLLEIKISFNKPISIINFDSLFLSIDSLNIIHFTDQNFTWDFIHNNLSINKSLDKKLLIKETPATQNKKQEPADAASKTKKIIKNQLTVGKGAFISIDKDSTRSKIETTKILREEDTGIIIIKVKTSEKNFIVQLLDKNYKPIATIKNKSDFRFENLPPAAYFLRLIVDKNDNGIWDPGNYFKKEEPENIIFYKNEKGDQTISLKANWEVGPLLITY